MIEIVRVTQKMKIKQTWPSIKAAQAETGLRDLGYRTKYGGIVYHPETNGYIMRLDDYEDYRIEGVRDLSPSKSNEPKRTLLEEFDDFWDFLEDCCKSR